MSAGLVTGVAGVGIELARPAAGPRTPVAATRGDRLALLDGVRLLAAAGIVWVHAAQSDVGKLLWPLGTFGVPFYTFVAVLFMTRTLTKPGGKSLGQYAAGRAARVYTPFLFWSAVYVLLAEAKGIAVSHHVRLPHPSVLYAGGHEHLWFLPFLMAVTIVGAVVVRGVQRMPSTRGPVIAILAVCGAAAAAWPEPAWVATRVHDQEFWRYALRASPTAFWALALSLAAAFGGQLPRTRGRTAILAAVLLGLIVATQMTLPPVKVLRGIAGLACVAVALYPVASAAIARAGGLGRHSYGIYLSHLVFLRIVVLWMEHFGTKPTIGTDVLAFAFAFAAAAGLSVLLSKSAWTRWTLGE